MQTWDTMSPEERDRQERAMMRDARALFSTYKPDWTACWHPLRFPQRTYNRDYDDYKFFVDFLTAFPEYQGHLRQALAEDTAARGETPRSA